MKPAQPVHWGNINIETAKDAAARSEKRDRKETKDGPFDSIVDASDLGDVKAEVEEVRQVHPSAFKGLTCRVENASLGCSSQQNKRDHNLGTIRYNKGLVWLGPR